jgi:hypothetical protein
MADAPQLPRWRMRVHLDDVHHMMRCKKFQEHDCHALRMRGIQ